MRWLESLRIAVSGLMANRLRSALTTLGILIGVAAVIMLVAIGNGASTAVQNQIEGLGTNLVQVQPGSVTGQGGARTGLGGASTLTADDAKALVDPDLAPDVEAAAPSMTGRVTAVAGSQNWQPQQFVGTTPGYVVVRNLTFADGAMFTDQDVTSHARVAVVGQTVATNLFGDGSDPVGQSMRINKATYRIIGLLTSKGSNGVQDQDDVVLAPISSVQDSILGRAVISSISVTAVSKDKIDAAANEVTAILLARHKITNPALADFQIRTQTDLITARTQATNVLTVLLGAVAAISLFVGGIGIMNIMLVTVTERTREIGIRKAIGARRRDILAQFLVESMLLSGIGGALGVAVGVFGSQHSPKILGNITPVVQPNSVILSFGVAVGIGLFFGIYPANRAASLRPIDALRYE